MALESFENRIDIKNLTVEQSTEKTVGSFNPEQEFSDQDWRGMLNELSKSRKNLDETFKFARLGAMCSIVFPDKRSELQLDDEAWDKIKGLLERTKSSALKEDKVPYSWTRELLILLRNSRISFPEQNFDFILTPEVKLKINKRIEALKVLTKGLEYRTVEYIHALADYLVVFPEADLVQQYGAISQDKIKDALGAAKKDSWAGLAGTISEIKLLKDLIGAEQVLPTAAEWKNIHQALKEAVKTCQTKGEWSEALDLASSVKIINATSAKITEQGIELSFGLHPDKWKEQAKPTIPEQKNF
jgi:hypothetical protein